MPELVFQMIDEDYKSKNYWLWKYRFKKNNDLMNVLVEQSYKDIKERFKLFTGIKDNF